MAHRIIDADGHLMEYDKRIRGKASVLLQGPAGAVKELRRAVTELHMAGAVLPAWGLKKPLGHPDFSPLYETA